MTSSFFLPMTFQLHDTIKDSVGDKVKNDYKRDGDDVFSFSIDILHYLVGSLFGFLMFPDISWPLVFCLVVVVVLFLLLVFLCVSFTVVAVVDVVVVVVVVVVVGYVCECVCV